jgi:hypothetical protein
MRTLAIFASLALLGCTTQADDDDRPYEGDDAGECADDADNDRDGLFDCDDPDCEGASNCVGDDDDDDDASDDDDFTTDDDDATATALMYAHTRSALYAIDPEDNLSATLIGNFNPPSFSAADIGGVADLAMDPDGRMYAIAWWELYRVDPQTAALTLLTEIGTFEDQYNALTALDDGRLVAGNGTQIAIIDPNTGVVQSTGALSSGVFAGDMVGLPDGLMYCLVAADTAPTSPTSLAIWNPKSGTTTSVGATGEGAMFGVGYALQTLYGFTEGGDIFTLDHETGAATLARAHGIPFWGAATNPTRWVPSGPDE